MAYTFQYLVAFFGTCMLLSGCGGLDVEHLPIPIGAVDEISNGSGLNDNFYLVAHYSGIEVGDKAWDKSQVTRVSDAAELHSLLDKNTRIFIRLPKEDDSLAHLHKTVQAAALRIKNKTQITLRTISINLNKIEKTCAAFKFEENGVNEYYISIAKKINKSLNKNDIILINLDLLPKSLEAKKFTGQFYDKRVLALSSNSLTAPPFDNKSTRFFLKGLSANEMYRLLVAHFSASINPAIKGVAEDLALNCARIIGALNPKSGLGFMNDFFERIDGLINKTVNSTNYPGDIKSILANLLATNLPFIDSLSLKDYTLTEIQDEVDAHADAFRGFPGILNEKLAKTRTKIKDFIFLPQILKAEIEKIVRTVRGIDIGQSLGGRADRITNAVDEAIKSFTRGETPDEIVKNASVGYEKSLSMTWRAENDVVEAIKNSATLKAIFQVQD